MSTNICSWRIDEDIDRDAKWSFRLFGINLKGIGRKPPIRKSSCKNFLAYVTEDFKILVYNILKRQEYAMFCFHQAWISDISISTDQNTLVAGGFDKTVSIWNFTEKSLRDQFECKSFVSCVEVSSISGNIVAGCTDGNFYTYSNKGIIKTVRNIHFSFPICVKMLEHDRIVSIGNDNFVIFWSSEMQKGRIEVWVQKKKILSVKFLSNYYIMGFDDFNFRIFKLK